MDFDAMKLADVEREKPVLVGRLRLTAPFVRRELYECAAWFRDHQLQPGLYPVIAARIRGIGPKNGDMQLACRVPTTIVAAYFGTLWGGVAIGPDQSGPREVGKASEYVLHVGDATHVRACLNPEAKHYWNAGEGLGELRHMSGRLYAVEGAEFEWLPAFDPQGAAA
jgi:hypothetical protein